MSENWFMSGTFDRASQLRHFIFKKGNYPSWKILAHARVKITGHEPCVRACAAQVVLVPCVCLTCSYYIHNFQSDSSSGILRVLSTHAGPRRAQNSRYDSSIWALCSLIDSRRLRLRAGSPPALPYARQLLAMHYYMMHYMYTVCRESAHGTS